MEAAKNKALDFFEKNGQTIFLLIGGAVVLFALVKAVSDIRNVIGPEDPNTGGGNTDIKNPGTQIGGATITNTQATTLAARLLAAMDGFGKAGDVGFEIIKSTFRGKTVVDFNLISAAFGTPRRSIFTGEESIAILGGEQLSLAQWLSVELSQKQLNELQGIIPGVF